jgi:hypothetical protein
MNLLPCPYLETDVELSEERQQHILASHPELGGDPLRLIAQTLLDPDEVRVDRRFPRSRLFSRWFDDLLKGKILVVAVVTDEPDTSAGSASRHWVVTAYPTRRVTQGVVQWARPS